MRFYPELEKSKTKQSEASHCKHLLKTYGTSKVSLHATCKCNRTRSEEHSYWGWSQGDRNQDEVHCDRCGAVCHFLTGESGHWLRAFRVTGVVREIIGSIGFRIYRL